MGTPQWTRFSPLRRTIEQLCKTDLTDVLRRYRARLGSVTELGVDSGGRFGDIGAPCMPAESIDAALDSARTWTGLSLDFRIDAIGEHFALNLWAVESGSAPSTALCLHTSAAMAWMGSERDEEGEWLVEFLLALVTALGADVCGYGAHDDYHFVYEPLDPHVIVAGIRRGSLFELYPAVHIVSSELISKQEIRTVMARSSPPKGFRYRQSRSGNHVFSRFGPE